MNIKDVKDIAAERGIKSGKLKKAELIRAIQQAEGNPTCFETGASASCDQHGCLWRGDCN